MACVVNGSRTDAKYLLLSVGGSVYAVKIPFVQKIVPVPSISPLPLTPAHILGAAAVNGGVYPVMDLRVLFGAGAKAACLPYAAVLLAYRGAQVCAVADSFFSVADLSRETAVSPAAAAPWVTGVIHSGAMSVNLLSVEYLFCGGKNGFSG